MCIVSGNLVRCGSGSFCPALDLFRYASVPLFGPTKENRGKGWVEPRKPLSGHRLAKNWNVSPRVFRIRKHSCQLSTLLFHIILLDFGCYRWGVFVLYSSYTLHSQWNSTFPWNVCNVRCLHRCLDEKARATPFLRIITHCIVKLVLDHETSLQVYEFHKQCLVKMCKYIIWIPWLTPRGL